MNILSLDHFRLFVEQQDDYSDHQKEHIKDVLGRWYIKKVVTINIVLLCWNLLGGILDTLIFGGGVVMLFVMNFSIAAILSPLAFYIFLNAFGKFIFVKIFLKEKIKIKIALLATIPYIGGSLLSRNLLTRHPIFLATLVRYIKFLRKKGLKYICKKHVCNENTIIK